MFRKSVSTSQKTLRHRREDQSIRAEYRPWSVEYSEMLTHWNIGFMLIVSRLVGARGGVVVKALRYKPAGRGFDSR